MKKRDNVWSWRHAIVQSGLPATTRHVLLTLSVHMNDAGESCFPSIDKLADETGLNRVTVIRHLALAESSGWIEKATAELAGQKWRRNGYLATWPDETEKVVAQDNHLSVEGGCTEQPPLDERRLHRATTFDGKVVAFRTEGGCTKQPALKEVNATVNSTPTPIPLPLPPASDARAPPPPGLNLTAWQWWQEYRRQIRRPLKPASILAAQRKLAAFGAEQMAVVEQSIANGWQGLFAIKPGGRHATREDPRSRTQRVSERLDDIARQDIEQNGLPDRVG